MKNSTDRPIVPGGLVGFFLLTYGLAELLPVLMAVVLRMPWDFFYQFPQPRLLRAAAIVLTAVFYGFGRVGRFHPKASPGYQKWLETTPWTSRQPLPFGPVLPVWQDAVVLAALAALMAWRGGLPWAAPVIAAALAYALVAGMTAAKGGGRAWAVALLWVAPLLTLGASVAWLLSVTAGLVALACQGLRRSLRELTRRKEVTPPASGDLGWPFMRLGPDAPEVTPRGLGIGIGALVGWWIATVGRLMLLSEPAPAWTSTLAMTALVSAPVALGRLIAYVEGYGQPFGRRATGRWVIPGYDRIFLAPACALAGGVAVTAGLLLAGAPANVAAGGGVAVAVAAAVEMGPTLRAWRLTGAHRITPSLTGAKYVRL